MKCHVPTIYYATPSGVRSHPGPEAHAEFACRELERIADRAHEDELRARFAASFERTERRVQRRARSERDY